MKKFTSKVTETEEWPLELRREKGKGHEPGGEKEEEGKGSGVLLGWKVSPFSFFNISFIEV